MLAAALLLPLGLLVLTDEGGRLRAPAASRQAIQLLVLFAAVGLLCLGPMFVVAVRAPAQAFSSMYGTAMLGIPQILTHGVSTFVPVEMEYGLPRPAMGIAL